MAVDREFVYIVWPWSRAQTWSWDLGPSALDPGLALGTRAWTLGLGLGPWTLAWARLALGSNLAPGPRPQLKNLVFLSKIVS